LKQKLDLSATISDKKSYKSKKVTKNNENLNQESISLVKVDLDDLQSPNETIPQTQFDHDLKWNKSLHKIQSVFNLLTPNKVEPSLVDILKIDEKIRFSF